MSKEKKVENDTPKIVGILDYGPFEWASLRKMLIAYFLLVTIFLLLMGLGIFIFAREQQENPEPMISFVFWIIFWVFIMSAFPIFFLIYLIKTEKKRKEVCLWLQDAVLLQAQSKEVGRKYALGMFPGVKLQIDFELGGMHYTRFSDSPSPQGERGGYYLMWRKYANRTIQILYSLKYDKVMILKPAKDKK